MASIHLDLLSGISGAIDPAFDDVTTRYIAMVFIEINQDSKEYEGAPYIEKLSHMPVVEHHQCITKSMSTIVTPTIPSVSGLKDFVRSVLVSVYKLAKKTDL